MLVTRATSIVNGGWRSNALATCPTAARKRGWRRSSAQWGAAGCDTAGKRPSLGTRRRYNSDSLRAPRGRVREDGQHGSIDSAPRIYGWRRRYGARRRLERLRPPPAVPIQSLATRTSAVAPRTRSALGDHGVHATLPRARAAARP